MADIEIKHLDIGDAGWLVQHHAELYAKNDGFDKTFEPLIAEILAGFIRTQDPAKERAFIAWQNGKRLGSVFCTRVDDDTAKLRLFLITPAARGQGLGKRLLNDCMGFARDCGYKKMQLWTHESHVAACALYAEFGWQLRHSKAVHSFGVDLVEQSWEIAL